MNRETQPGLPYRLYGGGLNERISATPNHYPPPSKSPKVPQIAWRSTRGGLSARFSRLVRSAVVRKLVYAAASASATRDANSKMSKRAVTTAMVLFVRGKWKGQGTMRAASVFAAATHTVQKTMQLHSIDDQLHTICVSVDILFRFLHSFLRASHHHAFS